MCVFEELASIPESLGRILAPPYEQETERETEKEHDEKIWQKGATRGSWKALEG